MFGIDNYLLFLLSGLLLNITPGSDTIYILSRTISQGRASGMASVFGIISGAVVHTLFAAFGLSVILMKSALIFNMIKWAGAGYLLYLGLKTLFAKRSGNHELDELKAEPLKKIFMQGFLTNLLNPKVALFFLAFLPQFVSTSNEFGALPFILLGLTFICTGTVWCCIIVIFSDMAAGKVRKGSIAGYLNKITGMIYIGLGIKLLQTSKPVS